MRFRSVFCMVNVDYNPRQIAQKRLQEWKQLLFKRWISKFSGVFKDLGARK